MFQTNTKHCVKLQFCLFLYICCHCDRLLGCCDRELECHLGRIRTFFFCLWYAMSPLRRAAAPTKGSYQMSDSSKAGGSWPHWSVAPYRQIFGYIM
jgi:hypothetical protein